MLHAEEKEKKKCPDMRLTLLIHIRVKKKSNGCQTMKSAAPF